LNTPSPGTAEKLPSTLNVAVIAERQKIDNPWQDYRWFPVAVVPGMDDLKTIDHGARLIKTGEGWQHFHLGTIDIELFAGETAGYKTNLAGPYPVVYVVLSPGEEAGDPDVVPFLVTVCPYEAESYTESGEDIVEGVVMPPEILAWVSQFVDKYHVEETFVKRKQKKAYDPRKQGLAGVRGPDKRLTGDEQ